MSGNEEPGKADSEKDRLDKAYKILDGWRGQDADRIHEALLLVIEEVRALRRRMDKKETIEKLGYDPDEGTLADRLGLPS